jgi:carbamoyltransferase
VVAVLGVNAVFHDPAAALAVDGAIVAAAEEERFTRRKHGKEAVPFSTWELPAHSARWCLAQGGLDPADVDVVSYSYQPTLALDDGAPGTDLSWEHLRTKPSCTPRWRAGVCTCTRSDGPLWASR